MPKGAYSGERAKDYVIQFMNGCGLLWGSKLAVAEL